jgi:hypothetical protein
MLAYFFKGELKMIIETKGKKVNLVYRTRKVVKINNILNGKNFEELYFNALNKKDIEALAQVIFVFAEDADTGLKAFDSVDEVYDFIDDYMAEKAKTYEIIYREIAEDINKEGFFNKKMTEEELMSRVDSPIGLNVDEIVQKSAEKAIANIIEPELMGQISKG